MAQNWDKWQSPTPGQHIQRGLGGKKARDPWETLMADAMARYGQPTTDPYQGQAQQWYNTVMAPGYQAYSPETLNEMYNQGADKLRGNVFNEWENNYGQSMANRNLTRSGVANLNMDKLLGRKGGALGQLESDIWQYGQDATRGDVSQALQSYPAFQTMNMQQQNDAWNKLMDLMGVQTAERGGQRQTDAANAAGLAQLFGLILSIYTGGAGGAAMGAAFA